MPKILERSSQKRIEEMKSNYNLDSKPIPKTVVYNVNSVNSVESIEFFLEKKPDLIIVYGTRTISKKVLNCINATFINTHAWITPKYRGVHGRYWAFANEDKIIVALHFTLLLGVLILTAFYSRKTYY